MGGAGGKRKSAPKSGHQGRGWNRPRIFVCGLALIIPSPTPQLAGPPQKTRMGAPRLGEEDGVAGALQAQTFARGGSGVMAKTATQGTLRIGKTADA